VEVDVQGFGPAREHLGSTPFSLAVPDGATVADVVAVLGERTPAFAELLTRCAIAVGDEIVPGDRPVAAGDLVAVLPPVAGGAT
jgi:molybdopterin converting factor small subunit